jgi:hypothetical protein
VKRGSTQTRRLASTRNGSGRKTTVSEAGAGCAIDLRAGSGSRKPGNQSRRLLSPRSGIGRKMKAIEVDGNYATALRVGNY